MYFKMDSTYVYSHISNKTRIFKNWKFKKLCRDWSLLQKVRKQGTIFWQDIFNPYFWPIIVG